MQTFARSCSTHTLQIIFDSNGQLSCWFLAQRLGNVPESRPDDESVVHS